MILLDTSIVSAFSRVDRLDLLFAAFETERLQVSVNVERELREGLKRGYWHLERATHLIDHPRAEMAIEVIAAGAAETALYGLIPLNPGDPDRAEKGEFDMVALAWTHGAVVVCNERRVANFCRSNSYRAIRCLSMEAVLRAFWEDGILSREDVRALVAELERQGEGVRVSLVL